MSNSKDVLDRVLGEIKSASVRETSAHSTYVSGVFEEEQPKNSVLDRVLGEIKSASAIETSAHSTYVSGVFED